MFSITDRLADSLHSSTHAVVNKVEVLVDGELVLTIEGRTVVNAAGDETSLVDGTVDVRRATIQRSCSITLADLSDVLGPDDLDDLFVPIRTEIRPYRGLLYSNRSTEVYPNDRELVPLGTFVITNIDRDWPSVTITGRDRMELLHRQTFVVPYSIANNANAVTAITRLLSLKIPAGRLAIDFPALDYTVGLNTFPEDTSPAERAHDIAASMGQMFFCDPMGTFTMRPEPTVDDAVVWSYIEGSESMLLPWPNSTLSAEDAKNAVYILGEQQGSLPNILASAFNRNAKSALNVSKVGIFPEVIQSSPIYKTKLQAAAGAATTLKKMGMSNSITLSGLVHPALASGDVLYVEASHPRGLAARLIIDDFSVPLRSAGPQILSCRAEVSEL